MNQLHRVRWSSLHPGLFVAGLVMAATTGCGDTAEFNRIELHSGLHSEKSTPTLEEFSMEHRVGTKYIVEGDIVLGYEDLVEFYEARHFPSKATGWFFNGGKGGPGYFSTRGKAKRITYCYGELNGLGWGDTLTDGTSAAAVSAKSSQLRDAMKVWERETNVRFISIPVSGSGCNDANPVLRVTPTDSDVSQLSAFAHIPGTTPGSDEEGTIRIGRQASGVGLFAHEIGHFLGLLHEVSHSDGVVDSGNNVCGASSPEHNLYSARDLTENVDLTSIMNYFVSGAAACVGTSLAGTPAGARPTPSDGYALRTLYGSPARWAPSYLSM